MTRPRGGYIGHNAAPAASGLNSAASGIWTLREAEALKRAGTWPQTTDDFFSSVSLLLHMDGTNESTTFTDSSSNAFAVTAVGDAKISTAESKFGGSSALFDGNGDYLTLGGQSAFAFGTGDWTIECWIYATQIDQVEQIFDFRQPGDGPGAGVSKINIALVDGQPVLYVLQAIRIQGSVTISLNQWYNLAVARASGTTRMFVNGVQTGISWVDSTDYTVQGSRPAIGSNGETPGGQPFNGYIDEVRITKGVARYTANFTPLTVPFPNQ